MTQTQAQTFTPPGPLNTAVLFLVFNRPDTTRQVFEAIRQAKPPRLYVAADGPRPNRPAEDERCEEVRRIATNVDWPCEVKTLFREANLGCKMGVTGGINWFFEHEEEGIILEDDCLPDLSFFWFCEGLLAHYRQDSRIGMIGGTRMADAVYEGDASYSYSRLVQIWGWATWRRAWLKYDLEMNKWPLFKKMKGFDSFGVDKGVAKYLAATYQRAFEKKVDTWDYQWSFTCVSEAMLTIFPKNNLIKNIGFGVDATHTLSAIDISNSVESLTSSIVHPTLIVPNIKYDKKKICRSSLTKKIISKFMPNR